MFAGPGGSLFLAYLDRPRGTHDDYTSGSPHCGFDPRTGEPHGGGSGILSPGPTAAASRRHPSPPPTVGIWPCGSRPRAM